MKLEDTSFLYCGRGGEKARSVSWNSDGKWLAWAAGTNGMHHNHSSMGGLSSSSPSASSNARISSLVGDSSQMRDVLTVSGGHNGAAVDTVRFHPTDPHVLITSSQIDRTVRIWDLRTATTRTLGRIDSMLCTSIEWGSSSNATTDNTKFVAVERKEMVHVFDSRKLNSSGSNASGNALVRSSSSQSQTSFQTPSTLALKTYSLKPQHIESCIMSPNGQYLIATTVDNHYMMGCLRIWGMSPSSDPAGNNNDVFVYPAHTGPVFHLAMSPDRSWLATAGGDEVIGIWDLPKIVCTTTIASASSSSSSSRRSPKRRIRAVSFSYDSKVLAAAVEEDGVDLYQTNGGHVGTVYLSHQQQQQQHHAMMNQSSSSSLLSPNNSSSSALMGRDRGMGTSMGMGMGGAEDVAFHPKQHILACARGDLIHRSMDPPPPIMVARLKIV